MGAPVSGDLTLLQYIRIVCGTCNMQHAKRALLQWMFHFMYDVRPQSCYMAKVGICLLQFLSLSTTSSFYCELYYSLSTLSRYSVLTELLYSHRIRTLLRRVALCNQNLYRPATLCPPAFLLLCLLNFIFIFIFCFILDFNAKLAFKPAASCSWELLCVLHT